MHPVSLILVQHGHLPGKSVPVWNVIDDLRSFSPYWVRIILGERVKRFTFSRSIDFLLILFFLTSVFYQFLFVRGLFFVFFLLQFALHIVKLPSRIIADFVPEKARPRVVNPFENRQVRMIHLAQDVQLAPNHLGFEIDGILFVIHVHLLQPERLDCVVLVDLLVAQFADLREPALAEYIFV